MDIDTLFAKAIAGDSGATVKLKIKADRLSKDNDRTILHTASKDGNTERVKFIVTQLADKNLLVKVDKNKQTALHLAAYHGYTEVVEVLIDAARRNHDPHNPVSFFQAFLSQADYMKNNTALHQAHDPHNPVSFFQAFLRQANYMKNTALHQAVTNGHMAIVKLLVEADPKDRHIQNNGGYSPIYLAAKKGFNDIVKMICRTCQAPSLDGPDGTTALHVAIKELREAKEEDKDVVKVLIDSANRSSRLEDAPHDSFEAFFNKTDDRKRTVLSLAVQRNHLNVVELILGKDPAYQNGRGSKNSSLKSLIYKEAKDGYNKDMIKLLCETYEAGNTHDPKGQTALYAAIMGHDEEYVVRLLKSDDKQLLTNADDREWTALHYAAHYKFDSVLEAIKRGQDSVPRYQPVYDKNVPTPLSVAVDAGGISTVVQLMKVLPASACAAVDQKGKNILHILAFQSNKEMIKCILKCCPEKCSNQILNGKDSKGNTPLHELIRNGCFVPELLKHKEADRMAKNMENWTPLDMLYYHEEIKGDQLQIKKALDSNQHWSITGKENTPDSLVPTNKRSKKDLEFKKAEKLLIEKDFKEKKDELDRYRNRTNTQIIITALITTVTFTVGFTMPGGLHQSGEVDEGLVLFSKKKVFDAFMVSDALALLLSTSSLFFYFVASIYDDTELVSKLNTASTALNIVSIIAMMLTFITGTYVVLSHSPALAITVSIIGCLFFLLVIVQLIKMIYDRNKEKKI